MTLKDKALFISGGSRGIDLEIGLRAARDGANVPLIAKTADQPRAALALRAGLRRGAARGRDRIQRTVAADADRDRRGAEPARRRRGDGRVAQAAAVRGRRLRGPHPPQPRVPGNTFLCEDVLVEEGVTDFDAYAYGPGATPQVDLFVDHV
jgi:NAD(P)-dependent dehydrogenase (short-subunit alcohol dehydrogenase family)